MVESTKDDYPAELILNWNQPYTLNLKERNSDSIFASNYAHMFPWNATCSSFLRLPFFFQLKKLLRTSAHSRIIVHTYIVKIIVNQLMQLLIANNYR